MHDMALCCSPHLYVLVVAGNTTTRLLFWMFKCYPRDSFTHQQEDERTTELDGCQTPILTRIMIQARQSYQFNGHTANHLTTTTQKGRFEPESSGFSPHQSYSSVTLVRQTYRCRMTGLALQDTINEVATARTQ